MSLKKFSIIFLIILILSINAVSADDSLSDLQVLVDSTDNVDLNMDFSFQGDDSNSGVQVSDKDIKINGNNHVIDGRNSSNLLTFNNCKVYIENLTLTNGYDTSGELAGAIDFFNSNVTLKNCIFTGNHGNDGGAILSWQNTLEIVNCTFTSNAGGAISIFNSNGVIDSSLFLNNSGSTVSFDYTYEHDFIISNTILNDNCDADYLKIFKSYENGQYYAYLSGYNNLADNQISLYVDQDSYLPVRFTNLTFINVSYNGFKNLSYKVKPEDLITNLNNRTILFEVLKDDVIIINTTSLTNNGKAIIDLKNLTAGNYQLNAHYRDLADSISVQIKREVNFTMSVDDIVFGEDLIIDFNISDEIENYGNAKGSFEIWDADAYGSRYYDVLEYYGDFKFIDDNIAIRFYQEGTFIAFLDFGGDDVFYPKRINQTFNVIYNRTGNYSVIEVELFEKTFGENKKLYFNLTDENGTALPNRDIQITINGVDYTRTTDSSGQASIAINLGSGSYTADFLFKGDEDYLPTSAYLSFDVLPTVYCEDMEKYVGDPGRFTVTCTDTQHNILTGGVVDFNINGVIYHRNINENGEAGLNINLSPGEYIITAKNPVTGELRSAVITVLPKIVNNHDLVKYFRNDSQFTVRLDGYGDLTGQTVTFNINGVLYERITDEKGIAKLNINLSPGQYIITAMYGGCMVSNNITVLPVLTAENMEMSYLDGSTFNATIVDGTGKPISGVNITFNINGVFYQRTTDDNGTARLNIRLMAGEYIITSIYDKAVTSNKITIV